MPGGAWRIKRSMVGFLESRCGTQDDFGVTGFQIRVWNSNVAVQV